MTSDAELLRRYSDTGSEAAFCELVHRHVNLVYSAALRQVNRDTHLAQDVTQSVFADLARKARTLTNRPVLDGWLYTSAHYAAVKAVRAERRRHSREQEAHLMQKSLHDSAPDPDWEKLCPVLDSAMHDLSESDREVILLRYFHNRPHAGIGEQIGVGENAARMRVERAVEKLRAALTRRGVTAAMVLPATLAANAVTVAPPELAVIVSGIALTGAATGTGTIVTLLKVGFASLVVAGVAVTIVVQHRAQTRLRDENQSFRRQIAQLQTDNTSLSKSASRAANPAPLSGEQSSELLRLRSEVGMLRKQTNELAALRSENEKLLHPDVLQVGSANELSPEDQFTVHRTHIVNAETVMLRAVRIYATNHEGRLPGSFDDLLASGSLAITNFNLGQGGKIRLAPGKWLQITTPDLDGNLSLNDFEFLKLGTVEGRKVLFRNRVPISHPPGDPVWIYGALTDHGMPSSIITSSDFTVVDPAETQSSPQPNQ